MTRQNNFEIYYVNDTKALHLINFCTNMFLYILIFTGINFTFIYCKINNIRKNIYHQTLPSFLIISFLSSTQQRFLHSFVPKNQPFLLIHFYQILE
uniref:7TM_GPCR_Srx domain-containing protein n=1 Tax=Heterorhabditis bacteriophora TaxID=37862 RepID=A0A1I7WKX9_HETBA